MVGLNDADHDDDNSKRLSHQVKIPILVYTDADTGVGMVKIRRLSIKPDDSDENDNNYDDDNYDDENYDDENYDDDNYDDDNYDDDNYDDDNSNRLSYQVSLV